MRDIGAPPVVIPGSYCGARRFRWTRYDRSWPVTPTTRVVGRESDLVAGRMPGVGETHPRAVARGYALVRDAHRFDADLRSRSCRRRHRQARRPKPSRRCSCLARDVRYASLRGGRALTNRAGGDATLQTRAHGQHLHRPQIARHRWRDQCPARAHDATGSRPGRPIRDGAIATNPPPRLVLTLYGDGSSCPTDSAETRFFRSKWKRVPPRLEFTFH